MFALIVIPVMYAYVSELYPTELRASGFGWASSSSRAITGFAPLLFGSVLWPVLGLPLTFTLLGLLVVAAVVFMWVAAPETAGRELDRITTDVPDSRRDHDRRGAHPRLSAPVPREGHHRPIERPMVPFAGTAPTPGPAHTGSPDPDRRPAT